MATITTALTHDQIEDLVGDISAATLTSASSTQITYSLTYTGDDLPHASSLRLNGSFTTNGQTSGTVTAMDFLDAGNASLLSISGLSLDVSQVQSLLANPDTFEDFVDHMGTNGDDDNLEIGGDDDDDLHGGNDDDNLLGGGGDDDLSGGRGDDHIDGGDGDDDTVHFGSGKKVFVNLAAGTARGEGDDTLANIENVGGSHRSDQITGDDGDNDLDGDTGNDKIFGLGGDDNVLGGKGNDKLDGGDGNDVVDGDDGNDKLFGQAGDDDLVGGKGNDHLDGGAGNDFLDGGDGNDKLTGGDGDDEIHGGSGNDNIIAGSGLNTVFADSGNDKITSGDGDDIVSGGDGNDKITSGGGDDDIDGGSGKDNIKAGDGNDFIDGGDGNDNMAGGAGDDTYVISSAKDKIVEQAGQGVDTVMSTSSFSLERMANVENIELVGISDSSATGNAADNELIGNDGNNTLSGAAGNDILNGGLGADTLSGGPGSDAFVFDNLAVGGIDTLTDFTSGVDEIALDDAVFTALAGSLDLSANYITGTAALDANDFLVFDGSTGALYYDQDGSGAGSAAVQIATLSNDATPTSSDFTVI